VVNNAPTPAKCGMFNAGQSPLTIRTTKVQASTKPPGRTNKTRRVGKVESHSVVYKTSRVVARRQAMARHKAYGESVNKKCRCAT